MHPRPLTMYCTVRYTTYMPQVTVFIRADDMPKWKAVEKKSEFMHEALQAIDVVSDAGKSRLYAAIVTKQTGEGTVEFKPSVGLSQERLKQGLCKVHGIPLDTRGRCLQVTCKYA